MKLLQIEGVETSYMAQGKKWVIFGTKWVPMPAMCSPNQDLRLYLETSRSQEKMSLIKDFDDITHRKKDEAL